MILKKKISKSVTTTYTSFRSKSKEKGTELSKSIWELTLSGL